MTQAAPQTLDRREIAERFRWNLDEIFPDFDAWERAVAELEEDIARMQSVEGTLSGGPKALLEALYLNDRIDERAQRVWWYPTLMHDEDLRRNEVAAPKQRVTALLSRAGTAAAWFRPELLSLGESTVREWIESEEGLKVYEFLLLDLFRQREHVLDAPRETLLSYTSQMANAPREAYSMLSTADAQWPTIELSTGEKIKLTYTSYHHLLSTCRQQGDRARAFEALYATFGAHRNTYAALYAAVCHREWFFARSRGYESSLHAALDGDAIPTEVVENLIATTRAGVAPLQRYFELRRRTLGLEEMHLYDGQVPLLERDPVYPYDTAVEHTVESVGILGEDYQQTMRDAFRSRWIDVYENEGKRSGAYSAPVHGVHPYMLLNHKDTLGDMFTLAHEMGHSMHTVLSQRAQPYVYSDYTIFVAEVASTLNEGLLLDHLVARTEDPGERALLLQHAIDSIVGTFYTQVLFADFELTAHRSLEAGEPMTADSLDELYGSRFADYYGDSVAHDPPYRHTWARIPHLFRAPYYVYQYATCFASAAAIRRSMREDEKKGRRDTVDRYLELLSSGSSRHPMDQLRDAGVDLRRPEPVEDVVTRVDTLVGELEQSLRELGMV